MKNALLIERAFFFGDRSDAGDRAREGTTISADREVAHANNNSHASVAVNEKLAWWQRIRNQLLGRTHSSLAVDKLWT